jgi:hypothetical protein
MEFYTDVFISFDGLSVADGRHVPPVLSGAKGGGRERRWAADDSEVLYSPILSYGRVNFYCAFHALLQRFFGIERLHAINQMRRYETIRRRLRSRRCSRVRNNGVVDVWRGVIVYVVLLIILRLQ